MSLLIRPFEKTDADYQAVVDLENVLWPDELQAVEGLKHRDETRDPKYMFQRLVGEIDGSVVACAVYGESSWSHVPGKYFVFVSVHPDRQRRGHGSTFYDHVTGILAERDPIMFVSDTREDKPDYIRFLTKRGYKKVMRYAVSRLDVASFDASRFEYAAEKARELGVEIRTGEELMAEDPNWKREMWELEWELLQDVPSPDPLTKPPFEQYEKEFTSPAFMPEAWLIAVHEGKYVGMSCLWRALAEKDKLYTGLTGVVRSHRRQRLATAMKVRAIEFAKEHGAKVIETDNEENNPMYNLNLELGFRATPAWLEFRKTLKDAEGQDSTAQDRETKP
jgi:mycothiol synthase